MLSVIGIILLFVTVFGSFILSGGNIEIIIGATPYEGMAIVGAAVSAFLIANEADVLRRSAIDLKKVFTGPEWKPQDYKDLLCLMFLLTKLMKTKGLLSVEPHIEAPQDSAIFKKFPRILGDPFAIEFICANLRMVSMNLDDPHRLEDVMEKQLEKHLEDMLASAHALQTMADGLPALGIVAAVLGVIKTMGNINEPPEILGRLIGGALVGTFLGVFSSYGLVGPVSSRLSQVADLDIQYYRMIKDTLISHLFGSAAQVSVEIARGVAPTKMQPGFEEMEEAFNTTHIEP
ncbi:MAG: flagellar motor stator protein MotA [Azospirillaceae bacterium]|nr:flagellar motor stator protein MotA [Azospirillaceae bacterium]